MHGRGGSQPAGRVPRLEGRFEGWEPRPGEVPFDLVCSAQAWHWVDAVEMRTRPRCGRRSRRCTTAWRRS